MSIKFSGHTMGTPKLDIYGAMELFKEIGYDGIEVRVAADGQIDSESISDDEVKKIRERSDEIGIEFSCLTSYYKDFTSDEREGVIKNLKRVIDIAYQLNCPLIRVYGGMDPTPEGVWFVENWNRTVTGIREVAKYAAQFGIGICIETHIGSLTMSVRDTVRMIEDVNMTNVGMLFDYAWVEIGNVEQGKEAVQLAARHIIHCHVKDWKLESRLPLNKQSCLMGEGTVLWQEVLGELKKIGYNGYISDEYEKYWYPEELPEPGIGMKHNLEWMKNIIT
jgi:sugar phosphate isomerase/epimerase